MDVLISRLSSRFGFNIVKKGSDEKMKIFSRILPIDVDVDADADVAGV